MGDAPVGKAFGSYVVTAPLGEGAMGTVYEARHRLIGKRAAIKVLQPEYSKNPEVVSRFFNEARAATSIEHRGIIEIFDFGHDDDGRAYIVMELLDGESLSARIRRGGRMAAADAVRIARQMASALGAAHARGITHRDLKPDNVFLVRDSEVQGGERVKLLDFGIAKLAGDGAAGSVQTRTGSVIGTPMYMAPEQCRGAGTIDQRADLYALGCILFELLCGTPPFVREGLGDLFAAHMFEAPPVPRTLEPSVPGQLEAIVLRLLAKRPDDRFASCAELVAALDGRVEVAAPASRSGPPAPAAHLATLPAASAPAAGGGVAVSSPAASTLGAAASEVALPAAGGSRGLLLGGLLVAVAALVAIVYVVATGDGEGTDDDPATAAGSAPPEPGEPAPAQHRGETQPDRDLAAARAAFDGERWADAASAAGALLAADPGNAAATALRDRAAEELVNQKVHSEFDRAAFAGDLAGMVAAQRRIGASSVYLNRAVAVLERHRGEFVASRRAAAAEARAAGDCAKIIAAVAEVRTLFPDAVAELEAEAAACKPRTAGKGSGGGTAPVKKTGARMTSGAATVTGSLPNEVIQRVIRRNIGQIKYCYEKELVRVPGLAGKVVVQFMIAGTGAVSSARVSSSTLGNAAAESCIVGRVRSWTFPAPIGGGVVVVNYPFMFTSAG